MRSRGVHVFLLRSPRLARTRKRYRPLLTIILMLLGKGAVFLRTVQTSGASAPPCPEHASKVRTTSSPLDGFSSSLVSKTQIPLKIPDCCRSTGGHCHCSVILGPTGLVLTSRVIASSYLFPAAEAHAFTARLHEPFRPPIALSSFSGQKLSGADCCASTMASDCVLSS